MPESHRNNIRKSKLGIKRPPLSLEWRQKISKANLGNRSRLGMTNSQEMNTKIGQAGIGRKHSLKAIIKMSNGRKGKLNPSWKGGLTPINKAIRHSIEYRLWREAVFARDNWTCQKCFIRGGKLHPHHIKTFAEFPELRFAIDNGQTLCAICHSAVHKKQLDN